MSDSFKRINKGLTFRPQSSTPPNPTNGDLWYDDVTDKFISVVNSVSDPVVTEAATQLLSNKTLRLSDGSNSAPAMSFVNQTSMGLYRVGTDHLRFKGADTTRFSIWNSGTNDNSILELSNNGSSTGDQFIDFYDPDVSDERWTLGRDDSDTGTFKLSQNNTLGTNDFILVTKAGLILLGASGGAQSHSVRGYLGITVNSASYSQLQISNTNAAGDAHTRYLADTTYWTSGIDKSASDSFKISQNSTLGTNDFFQITTGGALTLGASSGTQTHAINGDLFITKGSPELRLISSNTDSNSVVNILVGSAATTADPYITVSGASNTNPWSFGRDTSDSNAFKVSQSAGFGANDYFKITTGGALTLGVSGGSAAHTLNGSWTMLNSSALAILRATGSNSDSNFRIEVQETATTADPYLLVRNDDGTNPWAVGRDTSDTNAFKISQSSGLGTNDYFIVKTAGQVEIPKNIGLGGGANSNFIARLGDANPLSGATQGGASSNLTATSAATTAVYGYYARPTTADAVFTVPILADYYSENRTKGASSTITRRISYLTSGLPSGATNNAIFADNNSFTGDWAINFATTAPSLFLGEQHTQNGSLSLWVGADSAASTLTDATTKVGRIVLPHYTNAEEPLQMVGGSSSSTANIVRIGGGSSSANASTSINFYTAANTTTTTGTLVGSTVDGLWTIGAASSTLTHVVNGNMTVTGFQNWAQQTTPATPAAGYTDIYFKSDNKLYKLTSSGVETEIGGSSGMTNPMTTTGDIVYSSDNSGTPARLAIGPVGSVLQSRSGLPTWIGGRGPGRAVIGGGEYAYGTPSNTMDYVLITTTGNATDFGDLTEAKSWTAGCSSSTRGLFAGNASYTNIIDYITIATAGNATDFGDLTVARGLNAAFSTNVRGCFSGGYDGGNSNVIDYVTIVTTGNAKDFGDLTVARGYIAGCSSPVRGLTAGGYISNVIDYVTIATTGNATDFGDLTTSTYGLAACASDVRALFAGGYTSSEVNTIEYVTIDTTGNATDFGDLTVARTYVAGTSNNTTGIFCGGAVGAAYSNVIDYVTIATTGNATDFGDLTLARDGAGCLSDSHGGVE